MKPMIWTRYGMTEDQYREFLTLRPGCWICRRMTKLDGSPLRLYVDHDHKTGRVRGRLCYSCNRRLIGRRRDHRVYEHAAAYLKSPFDGRQIETGEAKVSAPPVRLRRRPKR
jgi:hypothetical protein